MFTSNLSTAFAALNYNYDANGNATTDGKYCYQYNEANQLKRVTICNGGQIVADYIYDYNGNRIEKKIYNSGSLQKTVYSPSDMYETTKLASNGATTNVSYYFVNDELVAKKNSDGSKNYFLNDHLGSIGFMTNSAGTVVETTQYYPYGLVRNGGVKNKFLYTGQENDPETGLDYYNYRYYNPQLGRFIQPDDQLQTPYDPQSLNNYSYVNNNPIRYNDPTGHCIEDLCIGEALIGLTLYANALAASPDTPMDIQFLAMAASDYSNNPSLGNKINLALMAGSVAIPGVSAPEVSGLSNLAKAKISGAIGESKLLKQVAKGISQFTFKDIPGFKTIRRADVVSRVGSSVFSYEAKTGYQALTKSIASQIAKDKALLLSGRVKSITWNFYRSPWTGKIGASQQLLNELSKAGIKYKYIYK